MIDVAQQAAYAAQLKAELEIALATLLKLQSDNRRLCNALYRIAVASRIGGWSDLSNIAEQALQGNDPPTPQEASK
jgi:hypothetical protein